jgi:hypothetical protein
LRKGLAVAGFAFVGAAFVIARIVIGLDVAAFVTALPINLRGYGLLPGGETRYLPACAPDLGGSDITNSLVNIWPITGNVCPGCTRGDGGCWFRGAS